jgi:hypothetical protein
LPIKKSVSPNACVLPPCQLWMTSSNLYNDFYKGTRVFLSYQNPNPGTFSP